MLPGGGILVRLQIVAVMANIVVDGPAVRAGAGLEIKHHLVQAVQPVEPECLHMMMVVADGATGDLDAEQQCHRADSDKV